MRLWSPELLAIKTQISIHAPARGATSVLELCYFKRVYFNPRTRTGCDRVAAFLATWRLDFNPRTRTGCDLNQSIQPLTASRFQSTHPHGVRRCRLLPFGIDREFQSTHPHGVRPQQKPQISVVIKFQSTHPHGVRLIQNYPVSYLR